MQFPWNRKEVKENLNNSVVNLDYKPVLSENFLNLTEQFKGEVEKKEVTFPNELGEEHPFDFCKLEGLYKRFGLFTSVVDKYIDYIVGPGFYIVCNEDERAKKIIEDFMRDVNLDTLLRAWIKEALVKGNGFLELGGSVDKGIEGIKVLNANYMYVVRDKLGKVLGYNQFKGAFDKFSKEKIIPFSEEQIAHIPFNIVGDCGYGLGMGVSSMKDIDNLLQQEKDMHQIINRKANSPLHAKLGKVEGNINIIPKQKDVEAFGQLMEDMDNKTEWATDPLVDLKVVDFGNIGDKFATSLEYDLEKLMYDWQMPMILMGKANIPEGIAKVQLEGFQRRVQSIQAEVEKVIEEKIFKRILDANGLLDVHVEFEWGTPSIMEVEGRLKLITDIVKSNSTGIAMREILEDELIKILKLDGDKWEELKDEQKKQEEEMQREMERQQAILPGQNKGIPQKTKGVLPKGKSIVKKVVKKESNYEYIKECKHCEESWNEVNDIQEWLGFNYKDYIKHIIAKVKEYDFGLIRGITESEREAGYLTEGQIDKLKRILENGFKEGKSMREMSKEVDRKLDLKDLYRMEDGDIVKGASGLPILAKSRDNRSIAIIRSEVTRLANMGAIEYYKDNGINKVRWVASFGNRTCSDCESMNGMIFEIGQQAEMPLHPMCRCTYTPIVEIK